MIEQDIQKDNKYVVEIRHMFSIKYIVEGDSIEEAKEKVIKKCWFDSDGGYMNKLYEFEDPIKYELHSTINGSKEIEEIVSIQKIQIVEYQEEVITPVRKKIIVTQYKEI